MAVNPTDNNQGSVNPTDQKQDNINADVNANGGDLGNEPNNHTIPYATFKKELDKRKDLENRLNKIENQRKKAKQDQLEKDGMLKEALDLAKKENEELQGFKEKLESYELKHKEKLLNKIPEDKRELAATFDIKAIEELSEAYNLNNKEQLPPVQVANAPAQRVNQSNDLGKDWFKMSHEDKRKNWTSILNHFSNK